MVGSGHRFLEREGERLEGCLGAVMVVRTLQHVDMQRHAPGNGERLEEMTEILGRHVAELGSCQTQLDMRRRPAGKIDHDPGQGFIEGREGMRESAPESRRVQLSIRQLVSSSALFLSSQLSGYLEESHF